MSKRILTGLFGGHIDSRRERASARRVESAHCQEILSVSSQVTDVNLVLIGRHSDFAHGLWFCIVLPVHHLISRAMERKHSLYDLKIQGCNALVPLGSVQQNHYTGVFHIGFGVTWMKSFKEECVMCSLSSKKDEEKPFRPCCREGLPCIQ